MIRPRWQKALSDIAGNLIRSALVVASIMVGLFAVGIITTLYVILQQDMQNGYAAANPANILVNAGWFEQDMVERISHLEGVRDAEGVATANLRVQSAPEEWISISIKAVRKFEEMDVNQVRLQAGRWPPGKNEIVLDMNKLSDLDAGLNDTITIELASGDSHDFKVVGIVQDQTVGAFGYGGGFFLAPMQAYIDADSLAYLNLPDLYNTLYVTVAGDGDNEAGIQQVEERVRDELEENDHPVYNSATRRSSNHPNYTYVDAMAGVLFLLGFLVVFLSGFLITNTLAALLNQQMAQIGIMKTVGAQRYQIMSIYMMVVLLFGIIACAISIPLSYGASNLLLEFLATRINIEPQGQRMVPLANILQVVIAVLVPEGAGFFPILRGARIPVQSALNGAVYANSSARRGGRRRVRMGLLPRPLVISLRNVFRHKTRLVLTLITLSLGGAVFIATFNVRSSLQVYIDRVVQYFRADVNITLDRYQRVEKVNEIVRGVPGVAYLEPWLTTRAEMAPADGSAGESFSMIAPPAGSPLVEPMMIKGRWIEAGDQNAIALSEVFLAHYPEIDIGDSIRIKINEEEGDWVVVGFFQLAGKSGGMVAYTDYEYLSAVVHEIKRSNTFRVLAAGKNLSNAEQNALAALIEARLKEHGMRITEITAGTYLYTSTAKGLDVLTTFLLIMAGLTALVGSIGLTGTMSLNVMERTREIGVLRAIGASDGSLFRMVIVEGALIGFLSWLIGSVLSFPISRLMSDTINAAIFDAPSTFSWTVDGFIIWLGLVLMLALVASIIPARSATRLTIREVLAYE